MDDSVLTNRWYVTFVTNAMATKIASSFANFSFTAGVLLNIYELTVETFPDAYSPG